MDSGGMVKNTVLVAIHLQIKITIKASSVMGIDVAKGSMHGQMEVFMMENGRKTK
jgi:hypothetical protein